MTAGREVIGAAIAMRTARSGITVNETTKTTKAGGEDAVAVARDISPVNCIDERLAKTIPHA
jgi:hypothetical protein